MYMTPNGDTNPATSSTMDLRKFIEKFQEATRAHLNDMAEAKQISVNDIIDADYWNTYAAAKFSQNPLQDPAELGKFAAESVLRQKLLNIVRDGTIELRSIPENDKSSYTACADGIDKASKLYNDLMGNDSLKPVQRKVINESAAAPSMIVFGRQYDNNDVDLGSAIDRFNMNTARNDPFAGGANAVLCRVEEYTKNNAERYSVDTEPELDKYVETIFLDPTMSPDAFEGNPYLNDDGTSKIENPPTIVPRGVEPTSINQDIDDDFLAKFSDIINKH